jgi:hypothetical protein
VAAPKRLLRKVLRYRDQAGRSVRFHAEHWQGFRFLAGPVIVSAVGSWGEVQVWAASEAEGRRVIRHAASAGGWDPDTEAGAEWLVSEVSDSRYGRVALVEVLDTSQGLSVSKRDGPSGPPDLVDVA